MDQVKMFYWQKLTKLNRPIQVNTSSAALTIGTWTSRTRLSTICRSNPNKNGATLTASQSWIKTFSHYGLTLPNNASNTSLDYQGTCVNDRLNKVKDRNVTKMSFPAAPWFVCALWKRKDFDSLQLLIRALWSSSLPMHLSPIRNWNQHKSWLLLPTLFQESHIFISSELTLVRVEYCDWVG